MIKLVYCIAKRPDLINAEFFDYWKNIHDLDALLAARQSPEWQTSTADETNFIDSTRVALFITHEHAIAERL